MKNLTREEKISKALRQKWASNKAYREKMRKRWLGKPIVKRVKKDVRGMAKSLKNYSNPKSPKLRELLRILVEYPLFFKTKLSGEKVLDLGCGWGFYFKINPEAYGIDIDDNCLRYLKKFGYRVIKADITKKIPFKDNFFKWVIAHDVLEHFELREIEKIFSEVHRVLGPNGYFFILNPNLKGYNWGLKLNFGHKHFLTFQEVLTIARGNFIIHKHFFYPLPRLIGNYFTQNKEVIILKNIKELL